MRPTRTIAVVAVAILTLLAVPASATPAVTLRVSPSTVVAGGTVTVSGSLGPVPEGSSVTLISKAFAHTRDFAGLPAIFATVKPEGTFAVTTRIPASRAPGTYTISGREGGGNLGVSATLVVRAAAAPTTTPAAAPPATTPPQASAPAVTAPATQPASHWLVPWLAALGSATLAALGMWLLYRRRHPAGRSRQGHSRAAH
jgi:hypothetical protein